MIYKALHAVLSFGVLVTFLGCGPYSFTGISIDRETKTFQVNYFQNNAALIEPGIERDFTLALQDLILNQTNLDLVKSNGDIIYEGEIVAYNVQPMTATANQTAAQNRLNMAVNVRFYNNTKEDSNFEKRFSFFYDFPATSLLESVKTEAHEVLFERITQDIFNASLADW